MDAKNYTAKAQHINKVFNQFKEKLLGLVRNRNDLLKNYARHAEAIRLRKIRDKINN